MIVVVKILVGFSVVGIKGVGNLVMKFMKYRIGLGIFEGFGFEMLKLKVGFGMVKDVCVGMVV